MMVELKLNVPMTKLKDDEFMGAVAEQYVEKCKDDFPDYDQTRNLTILNAEEDRVTLTDNFNRVLTRFRHSGRPQELQFSMGVLVGIRYHCKVTVEQIDHQF